MRTNFARRYAEISQWQYGRGLALLEIAKPSQASVVVDLGCGTGELSMELARRVGQRGRVIAIDPDAERLREAMAAHPPELPNLEFRGGRAQHLEGVADSSVDLVFSNYVVQWVLDHAAMLREVERVLRPGGSFAAEFVGEASSLLEELLRLVPGGEAVIQHNAFREDSEWRALVAERAFDVVRWDWLALALDFDSLAHLYAWLEGTTHGGFQAAEMPADETAAFAKRFPAEVSCPMTSFRMLLKRR